MDLVKIAIFVAIGALVTAFLLAVVQPILSKRLRKAKKRKPPPVHRGEDTAYTMFDDSPLEEGPDFDAIGEAKIHLAYGNRQKAMSILAKAAEEHPEREDIKRKLEELKAAGH